MVKFITLDKFKIADEHICCAFSDKKCKEGYDLKKEWLSQEFENGYVFRRLDVKAKVFIEYGPAEKGWAPILAPNYLLINCFWVSGQYKGHGYAKELLRLTLEDAQKQGKSGLVTVVGTTKYLFMSDTKWLLKNGFETIAQTSSGFSLLVKKLRNEDNPKFNDTVLSGECAEKNGLVAYYSNRCPYTEYYVNIALTDTAKKKNIPLKIIKIDTLEKAQVAPAPATIFSLFYNGKFITTDLSVCLENKFDKLIK